MAVTTVHALAAGVCIQDDQSLTPISCYKAVARGEYAQGLLPSSVANLQPRCKRDMYTANRCLFPLGSSTTAS